MFHHFHGKNHPKSQGSVSADQFENLILKIKLTHEILSPTEYFTEIKLSRKKRFTCLTFDDALLSQFEIAFPVLEAHSLIGLFNVYSAAFQKFPPTLELHRYFRNSYFSNVNQFNEKFIDAVKSNSPLAYKQGISRFLQNKDIWDSFPFYTETDKLFRFFRDYVLTSKEYSDTMNKLFVDFKFNPNSMKNSFYLNEKNLKLLSDKGQEIGLHSNTHPNAIHNLNYTDQLDEYRINFNHVMQVTNKSPIMMAHPCGNYNYETLLILHDLGIKAGFRSNLSSPVSRNLLEMPREDHINLLKMLV